MGSITRRGCGLLLRLPIFLVLDWGVGPTRALQVGVVHPAAAPEAAPCKVAGAEGGQLGAGLRHQPPAVVRARENLRLVLHGPVPSQLHRAGEGRQGPGTPAQCTRRGVRGAALVHGQTLERGNHLVVPRRAGRGGLGAGRQAQLGGPGLLRGQALGHWAVRVRILPF